MSAVDAFRAELHRSADRSTDPIELLPDRMMQACVAALPFDGAGLSFDLLPGRRLPWGASDPMAASAERLQFALGDGPCAAAHRERTSQFSTWEDLSERWPRYAAQLAAQTPYRCTLATPVGGPLTGVAVLVLYRRRSGSPADGVLGAVGEVAGLVGEALVGAVEPDAGAALGTPPSLRTAPVVARQRVWSAISSVAGSRMVSHSEALALLRARAFSAGTDLETVARQVLDGEEPG